MISMAVSKRDDPDLIAAVVRLHAEGKSRAAIGRTLGCSPSTVGLIAEDNNLNWDRSTSTVAATTAKTADNRARRAALVDRLYAAAERDLARLEDNTYTHRVNAGQSSFVVSDSVPNADEVRNHMQGIYSAIVSAAKLEALDTDPGVALAKSTLTAIADAIGLPRKTV